MSEVFKALADPTRQLILDELCERDGQTLFEICSRLAMRHGIGMSRQAISQHLALLEAADLVRSRKEGRCKIHEFNPEPIAGSVARWLRPKDKETNPR